MSKRPKMAVFLAVYTGLLVCFALKDAMSLVYRSTTGLSLIVAFPLGVIGAVVISQIWANVERKGCVGALITISLFLALTTGPVFLSMFFLNSVGISPAFAAEGDMSNFFGSIVIGALAWVAVVDLGIGLRGAWRYLAPRAVYGWHRLNRRC